MAMLFRPGMVNWQISTLLLSILVLLWLPLQKTQAASISELNPISHWTCNESSGVRYDSVSSTTNDLSDINGVGSQTGLLGNACDFESTSQTRLRILDAFQVGLDFTSSFSINLWIKYESVPGNNAAMRYVTKWDSSTGDRGYTFFQYNDAGTQKMFVELKDSGTTESFGSANWTPSTGVWYMLTETYDSSSQTIKFYVNGAQQGTNQTGQVSNVRNTSADFMLGASYAETIFFFDGLQDEISVFNYTLSGSQISTLYNSGVPLNYEPGAQGSNSPVIYTNSMLTQTQCTFSSTSSTCVNSSPTTTVLFTYDPSFVIFGGIILFFIAFWGLVFYFKK